MREVDGVALVTGPRGRRLCWALLEDRLVGRPGWSDAWRETASTSVEVLTAELVAVVADVRMDAILDGDPDQALFARLGRAVDWARYWQEPDGVDRALAAESVREALVPVARAIAAAAPAWWSDSVALDAQRAVAWVDSSTPPPSLTGAPGKLAAWRADTLRGERQAATEPLEVPVSGYWWSAPCLSRLPTTTRVRPGRGAVGLTLVEDHMGWTAAWCSPVAPTTEPRVFEVAGPRDWIELVGRYPLDVARSRRHDWWRATGVDGAWQIPDYLSVARDYDAVHVTTEGYLTTAGIALPLGGALPAGDACTVLAGWNPDETYWLTDSLEPCGPPELWTAERDDLAVWRPADAA